MGTRGCFGVHIDDQDKLTYNHFDSYPEGLGQTLIDQTRQMLDGMGVDGMRKLARELQPINGKREPTAEEIEKLKPYTDLTVSDQSTSDWYCLTRNLQGDLMSILDVGLYHHDNDFIKDSLFCEFAYIVNLDSEVFEVYVGFQDGVHNMGRFANLTLDEDEKKRQIEIHNHFYSPCALVATYPLSSLPKSIELPKDEIEA